MLRIEGMNTHYGASHVLQGVDLDMPQGRRTAWLAWAWPTCPRDG